MSSVYDGNLTVSIFGQSHAPAIGVTIDGLPAGLPVDLDALGRFLRRRAPGQNAWSTPRKEADLPEFLCGLKDGRTCGAPLTAIIRNTNTRSGDYENLMDIPRPGHADYTAQVKFGGAQDAAGGGHFSGRLTAPLCIAGGLCLQILARQGVRVRARIVSIGTVTDDAAFDAPVDEKPFPAVSDEAAAAMQAQIAQAKADRVRDRGAAGRDRRSDVRGAGKPHCAHGICHSGGQGRGIRRGLCRRTAARQRE